MSRWTRILMISLGALALLLAAPAAADDYDSGLAFKGQATYNLYCRSCHGDEAKGDGTVADILTFPPADLTLIAQRNGGTFPTDDIQAFIDGRKGGLRGHGAKDMPIWGDAFATTEGTDDDGKIKAKIENLVHYLISIQAKGD